MAKNGPERKVTSIKKLKCHYCGESTMQGSIISRRVSRRKKDKVFVCAKCCKKKGLRR